jgi:tetratricopeptide (TPR) repeat protein
VRLRALTPAQLDELLAHLHDQWHALVKTDNLLGPRHALTGVHDQLAIIGALLRTSRPPLRAEVLRLGAQYAESAAWLHEDSGGMDGSRYWTGVSMEWAVEADDRRMVSWSLFRRSQQARADGDAAQVIGLACAARRERAGLSPPMLAAILQQEAQGHALDSQETTCQTLLDQAHTFAADPNDPGDARTGHGSFCTPGYLEMQRGGCWLALGRPSKAVAPYKTALRELPAVYRRDRGVALAGLATAFAADGEAEEAASAALEALGIARSAGSARILNMVKPVADALPSDTRVPGIASLREALAETLAV